MTGGHRGMAESGFRPRWRPVLATLPLLLTVCAAEAPGQEDGRGYLPAPAGVRRPATLPPAQSLFVPRLEVDTVVPHGEAPRWPQTPGTFTGGMDLQQGQGGEQAPSR